MKLEQFEIKNTEKLSELETTKIKGGGGGIIIQVDDLGL